MNKISKKAKIGENVKIGNFNIIEDNVEIGDNTEIGDFCVFRKNCKIGENCKFTAYCEIRNDVEIGDNVSFGSRCTISANSEISNNVLIKYGFVLTDTPNLKENNNKNVGKIGQNTLIGANVTLMPGFSIGENCIIGACSQIRNDIPNNEIWFGNPAKLLKINKI